MGNNQNKNQKTKSPNNQSSSQQQQQQQPQQQQQQQYLVQQQQQLVPAQQVARQTDYDVVRQSKLLNNLEKYRDEEDPISKENQEFVKNTEIDMSKQINLSIQMRRNQLKVNSSKSQQFPVMVQLKTNDKSDLNDGRAAIDIICVIDDSGSMSGQKVKLVRKSLKFILKVLGEKDRICLVSFDGSAQIKTPFLRINKENKERIKAQIDDIKGRGSTCIHSGVENALWMIKNRKEKNPITCMFLLTDGQDDTPMADVRIQKLLEHYQIQEKFTINCYGYGNDHDPDVMRRIAKIGEGGFYYIEKLNQIQDYFILSLSGYLNILSQKVVIQVEALSKFDIVKRYGDELVWNQDNQILLPFLVQGERKEYFMDVELQKQKGELKDEERHTNILRVVLRGEDLNKKPFEIIRHLEAQLINENEEFNLNSLVVSEDFEIGYLKSIGGVKMGEASTLANQSKYEEAKAILQGMIQMIKDSKFADNQSLQLLLQDLQKSLELCEPRKYEAQGKAFMYKKNQDYVERRASIGNKDDWNQQQIQNMNDYDEGELCLSICDLDKDDQDDEFRNNNNSYNFQAQRQHSGLVYSDEEQEDVGNLQQRLSDIQN